MLNHLNCMLQHVILADVIAKWQMEWPLQGGRRTVGRSEGCSQEGTTPRQNITKEEQKAITKLKKDKTRIILTADKGVSLVDMNKEDYVKKADEMLVNLHTEPSPVVPQQNTRTS